MATANNDSNNTNNTDELNPDGTPKVKTPPVDESNNSNNTDPLAVKAEEIAAERLKPIKEKLDKVYEENEKLKKQLKEKEEKEQAEKVERLKAEGKEAEALKLELDEEKKKREAAEARNTALERDNALRQALGGFDFKNSSALNMAFGEILPELVRQESGAWTHKSGVTILDYVTQYSKNEDKAFLFKVKQSSGGGSGQNRNNSSNNDENKSIFARSQDEVIKLAAEGKLPIKRRR